MGLSALFRSLHVGLTHWPPLQSGWRNGQFKQLVSIACIAATIVVMATPSDSAVTKGNPLPSKSTHVVTLPAQLSAKAPTEAWVSATVAALLSPRAEYKTMQHCHGNMSEAF
jgi:hypothetical protein